MHAIPSVTRKRRARRGRSPSGPYMGCTGNKNQQSNQAKVREALAVDEATPMIQPKLKIGAQNDPLERQAEHIADRVMGLSDNDLSQGGVKGSITPIAGGIQRACDDCQEELLQAKTAPGQEASAGADVESGILALKNGGSPLPEQSRAFFEPRFGQRFDDVRLHTDSQASQLAQAVNAKAFTVGNHIVFGRNEYQPQTDPGKRLMGHELTHVVQQGASDVVRRQALDPLCNDYDFAAKKANIEFLLAGLIRTNDVERRLSLIQDLKWIIRCGSDAEKAQIQTQLNADLGAKKGEAIWREAALPFAGYRGVYPGYYDGAKGRLEELGTSEVEGFDSTYYDLSNTTDNTHAALAGGSKVEASEEAAMMETADILYFYGDQYAQYGWPGLFSKFSPKDQFIDLGALQGEGDFSRVKLMISTSCATCCKEAIETFVGVFPNAVILGYRKSAPKEGNKVRNAFDNKLRALGYPLLVDNPTDVATIISLWKSVIEQFHPNEDRRLPGYYQNGTIHYLERGVWKSMGATDAANSCHNKGSDVQQAN